MDPTNSKRTRKWQRKHHVDLGRVMGSEVPSKPAEMWAAAQGRKVRRSLVGVGSRDGDWLELFVNHILPYVASIQRKDTFLEPFNSFNNTMEIMARVIRFHSLLKKLRTKSLLRKRERIWKTDGSGVPVELTNHHLEWMIYTRISKISSCSNTIIHQMIFDFIVWNNNGGILATWQEQCFGKDHSINRKQVLRISLPEFLSVLEDWT